MDQARKERDKAVTEKDSALKEADKDDKMIFNALDRLEEKKQENRALKLKLQHAYELLDKVKSKICPSCWAEFTK